MSEITVNDIIELKKYLAEFNGSKEDDVDVIYNNKTFDKLSDDTKKYLIGVKNGK